MALSFDINYIAVLASAIAGMVLGALWYGPLFGKRWIKLMNFSEKDIKKAKQKSMAKSYVGAFIGTLIFAYVLALMIVNLGAATLAEGFVVAFLLWLGFIATSMLNSVIWEGKPVELYTIGIAHYLVVFLAMSAILVFWA